MTQRLFDDTFYAPTPTHADLVTDALEAATRMVIADGREVDEAWRDAARIALAGKTDAELVKFADACLEMAIERENLIPVDEFRAFLADLVTQGIQPASSLADFDAWVREEVEARQ